jgi:hypothetical protein
LEFLNRCLGRGRQEWQRLGHLERLVRLGLPAVYVSPHPSLTQKSGKKFQLSQPAIRMPPTVDSLHATSATSVFLYEAILQRRLM